MTRAKTSFVERLTADLERRAAELELMVAELTTVRAGLAVLRGEPIPQLELEDKGISAGGPNAPTTVTVDTPLSAGGLRLVASERKTPVVVSLERVRDFICDTYHIGSPFSTADVSDGLEISMTCARRHIASLTEQGMVRRPPDGPSRGVLARWERPPLPAGPTERPRGGALLGVPAQRSAGAAVPGTGVRVGPAETPGKLRRQQRKAARVHHKPVKGVRV